MWRLASKCKSKYVGASNMCYILFWADFFWHPAVFVFGSSVWNQGSSLQATMLGKINWHSERKELEWNTSHSWMGILQTGYNSAGDCHRKKKTFLNRICDKGTVFLRILMSNNFSCFPHSPISTKSRYTRVLAEKNYSKNNIFFPLSPQWSKDSSSWFFLLFLELIKC